MKPTPLQPPPTDAAQQQLRQTRGGLFDNLFGVSGYSTAQPLEANDPRTPPSVTMHRLRQADELPAAFADTIIVGQIKGIQAYQSNNHTAIYTESTVAVEQLVSQQGNYAAAGGTVVFEQAGGSIELSSGRVLAH